MDVSGADLSADNVSGCPILAVSVHCHAVLFNDRRLHGNLLAVFQYADEKCLPDFFCQFYFVQLAILLADSGAEIVVFTKQLFKSDRRLRGNFRRQSIDRRSDLRSASSADVVRGLVHPDAKDGHIEIIEGA